MTDSEILNELPIQNLNIQEDGKEEEKLPEITGTLVLPPEAAAVTPRMEEMEWKKKDAHGLTDQEKSYKKMKKSMPSTLPE